MSTMTPEQKKRHGVVKAAARLALQLAYRDDDNGVDDAMSGIDLSDAQEILWTLCAWADVAIHEYGMENIDPERGLAIGFITTEGEIGTASDVPPKVAWAGRFLAARALRDNDTLMALFRVLPTLPGKREGAEYMEAVLDMATLIAKQKRGKPL